MTGLAISDTLRRLLLSGTIRVPHVEAILLMRRVGSESWDAEGLAERLYMNARQATDLLAELSAIGVVRPDPGPHPRYRYSPKSEDVARIMDQLEAAYTRDMKAVTRLIHSVEEGSAISLVDAVRQ